MKQEIYFHRTNLQKNSRKISGYAAVYFDAANPGTEFPVTEDYFVRFVPGSLKLADTVFAYHSHDTSKPIGKSGKNLKVWFDGKGMPFELDLPDTSVGNDVAGLIEAGVIEGCSFGCVMSKSKITREGNKDVRWIEQAEVFEISPTHNPAFASAEIALLERDAWVKKEIEKYEKILQQLA